MLWVPRFDRSEESTKAGESSEIKAFKIDLVDLVEVKCTNFSTDQINKMFSQSRD